MPAQTISSSYLFKIGTTFFLCHRLAVLLSLKEIVVEGFPYLILLRLRAFPAKHPLFTALRIYQYRYIFISSYAISTIFSAFAPQINNFSLSFQITV
jgi:hypothetical protein